MPRRGLNRRLHSNRESTCGACQAQNSEAVKEWVTSIVFKLRKQLQEIDANREVLEESVKAASAEQLKFLVRMCVASSNLSEELEFSPADDHFMPPILFNDIFNLLKDDDHFFDANQLRNAFLGTIDTLAQAMKKDDLDAFVEDSASCLLKVMKACDRKFTSKGFPGRNEYLKIREGGPSLDVARLSVISAYLSFATNTAKHFVHNKKRIGQPAPDILATVRFPKLPVFEVTGQSHGAARDWYLKSGKRYLATQRGVSSDRSILYHLDDVGGLDELYQAYITNPHVTYLLAGRDHPLLQEAACKGEGSLEDARDIASELKPLWDQASVFLKSRLYTILDAPCTTESCMFHGTVMRLAEAAKDTGNKAYGQADYTTAFKYYAYAVGLVHWPWERKAVFLSNAAQCLLKLGCDEAAATACTAAIAIQPSDMKAWNRRSIAMERLGNMQAALQDAQMTERIQLDGGELDKDVSERLRRLRALLFEHLPVLKLFESQGDSTSILSQKASLIRALAQQVDILQQQADKEYSSLLGELATALVEYSRSLYSTSCQNQSFDERTYVAVGTILNNLTTVLLLSPNDVSARSLRAEVAASFGELELAQADLYTLGKGQGNSRTWDAVRAAVGEIHEDLDSSPYFSLAAYDSERLHGSKKCRQALRCKDVCSGCNMIAKKDKDKDIWRDGLQMQEEQLETPILSTYTDAAWSSTSLKNDLLAKWRCLSDADKCRVTSISEWHEIVARLRAFGNSRYDHRGPYAASQARVDLGSSHLGQTLHEAWSRALEDNSLSYTLTLSRSSQREVAVQFAGKHLVVPLPQDFVFGPAMSCGFECDQVNDSNAAWWKLDQRTRSVAEWTSCQVEVVDASLGFVVVRLKAKCTTCKESLPFFAFTRLDLREAHDSNKALQCRYCSSGVKAMRGMFHLRRADVHDQALLRVFKDGGHLAKARHAKSSSKRDKIQALVRDEHECGFAVARIDWLMAAFDLFEDRLLGVATLPNRSASKHCRTADTYAVDEDVETGPSEQYGTSVSAPFVNPLLQSIMHTCLKEFGSLYTSQFTENAKCCAACHSPAVDGTKLLKCAGCTALRFCSKACIATKWNEGHKKKCITPSGLQVLFQQLSDRCSSEDDRTLLMDIIANALEESEVHRNMLANSSPTVPNDVCQMLCESQPWDWNLFRIFTALLQVRHARKALQPESVSRLSERLRAEMARGEYGRDQTK